MKRVTKRQRQLQRGHTAVHEAAHAVIGRVLELSCGGASIVENEAEGEAGHAIIFDPWATLHAWDERNRQAVERGEAIKGRYGRAAFRGTIIARMAGAEAERVLLGKCQGGDRFDRREIDIMGASRVTELADDLWLRYEPRMRRQTRRLVYKHREAIRLVANALLDRGELQSEEIDVIIDRRPR